MALLHLEFGCTVVRPGFCRYLSPEESSPDRLGILVYSRAGKGSDRDSRASFP